MKHWRLILHHCYEITTHHRATLLSSVLPHYSWKSVQSVSLYITIHINTVSVYVLYLLSFDVIELCYLTSLVWIEMRSCCIIVSVLLHWSLIVSDWVGRLASQHYFVEMYPLLELSCHVYLACRMMKVVSLYPRALPQASHASVPHTLHIASSVTSYHSCFFSANFTVNNPVSCVATRAA